MWDVNWRMEIYSMVGLPPGLGSGVLGRKGIHSVLEVSLSRMMEVLELLRIPHSSLSRPCSPDTIFSMAEFTLAGIYNIHSVQ